MPTTIKSNISRLKLHDSRVEKLVRFNQQMELTFDGATLSNFIEENIAEPIILGQTTMHLTGIKSEEFKISSDQKVSTVPFPNNFTERFYTISSNEISDTNQTIKISGLFRESENAMYDWVEWSFAFSTCELSWNSHITLKEWRNGKLPTD